MKITHCRKCNAEMVWLATSAGKTMPVNADTVREGDEVYDHTRHVSHFATCKFADSFRKPKPPDDLFDLAAARAARDNGMAQANENAEDQWKRAALACVHTVALRQASLVSDDVEKILREMPVETHEKRALGPIMLQARKKGWIESTGTYVQSSQKQCHANTVTLWRSLLFRA